jgi:hypothetical protein
MSHDVWESEFLSLLDRERKDSLLVCCDYHI